jgi:hypothetical protein
VNFGFNADVSFREAAKTSKLPEQGHDCMEFSVDKNGQKSFLIEII